MENTAQKQGTMVSIGTADHGENRNSRPRQTASQDSGECVMSGSYSSRDPPPAPSRAGKCWAGGQQNTLALTMDSFLTGIISLAALLSRLAAPQPGHQPATQLPACRALPKSSIYVPGRRAPHSQHLPYYTLYNAPPFQTGPWGGHQIG